MSEASPRSVRHFKDLPTLYAAMIETPEFKRAFGDPLSLSIVEPGDEPGEHDMPEQLAAQAECGAVIATVFDLLAGTRLEPLSAEIAWGFVNSFHFVASKLERREDARADSILRAERISAPAVRSMPRLEKSSAARRSDRPSLTPAVGCALAAFKVTGERPSRFSRSKAAFSESAAMRP